jgi:hypothetical protein
MFGSNYAREASFTDQQWIERINGHNSDCFGLFYGDQLIGPIGLGSRKTADKAPSRKVIRNAASSRGSIRQP